MAKRATARADVDRLDVELAMRVHNVLRRHDPVALIACGATGTAYWDEACTIALGLPVVRSMLATETLIRWTLQMAYPAEPLSEVGIAEMAVAVWCDGEGG